jgi:putative transposase of IS4/5 family DUF4096
MPRRLRRPAAPETLPPDVLPPDFLERHGPIHRLYLRPLTGLTPPRPWEPLSDAEWDAVVPLLRAQGCGGLGEGAGRPMADPRARLDAVFRAVILKRPKEQGGGRAAWRMLPEGFGKVDTVSRTHRRWARANLWARLLAEVARPDCPPALKGLTHWVCCAFRRAIRIMGLRAIVLARRLGLYSALPAPSTWLPDPDLSEICVPVILRAMERAVRDPGWRPPRAAWRLFHAMHRLAGGRTRIPRSMEPA